MNGVMIKSGVVDADALLMLAQGGTHHGAGCPGAACVPAAVPAGTSLRVTCYRPTKGWKIFCSGPTSLPSNQCMWIPGEFPHMAQPMSRLLETPPLLLCLPHPLQYVHQQQVHRSSTFSQGECRCQTRLEPGLCLPLTILQWPVKQSQWS